MKTTTLQNFLHQLTSNLLGPFQTLTCRITNLQRNRNLREGYCSRQSGTTDKKIDSKIPRTLQCHALAEPIHLFHFPGMIIIRKTKSDDEQLIDLIPAPVYLTYCSVAKCREEIVKLFLETLFLKRRCLRSCSWKTTHSTKPFLPKIWKFLLQSYQQRNTMSSFGNKPLV